MFQFHWRTVRSKEPDRPRLDFDAATMAQRRHGGVPAAELIASDENWPYTIYKTVLTKPWVVYTQKASPAWPARVEVAPTGGKAQKRAWKVRERGGTWRASASGGCLQSI